MAERKCAQRADKLLPGNSAYCNCVIVGNVQLKALPIIPFRICKLWRWSENFNRNMLQQGNQKKKIQENMGKKRNSYIKMATKQSNTQKKNGEKGKEILCNFWSRISAFYSFYYNFAFFFHSRCSTALATALIHSRLRSNWNTNRTEKHKKKKRSSLDFLLRLPIVLLPLLLLCLGTTSTMTNSSSDLGVAIIQCTQVALFFECVIERKCTGMSENYLLCATVQLVLC